MPPVRQGEDRRGELPPVHPKGEAVAASDGGVELIETPEYWTKEYNDLRESMHHSEEGEE